MFHVKHCIIKKILSHQLNTFKKLIIKKLLKIYQNYKY